MYSHLTDGSQELYPGVLTDWHTAVHPDKVYSLSDPRSDSRSLQVLLSDTRGYGSALAVCLAESITKHLLPCSTFHKPCSTLWLLTGVLLALTHHQTTFQVPANFYWLDFLLGTFHSRLSYSGLRNNTIFILSSLNIKGMEAVNKVESFAHNSHTTKYPPYPQCSWNSDSLSWDKQLASSDIFFQSVSFFTDVQLLQLISSNFLLQGWSLVCVV